VFAIRRRGLTATGAKDSSGDHFDARLAMSTGKESVMSDPHAAVGDWYRRTNGDLFEVVAIDDDDETIDIQHFDGTIEEIDFDSWESQCQDKAFEAVEAPEDWSGSVDMEPEDSGEEDDNNQDRQWAGPLGYLERGR
jgi:hypothetical protein